MLDENALLPATIDDLLPRELQQVTGSEAAAKLAEILEQLSVDQIRYIVARQYHSTDKAAADAIKISCDSVYHWPPIVKEAVRLMAVDGFAAALYLRRKALAAAMMVKVEALRTGDPLDPTVQRVATEIIEWELGQAVKLLDITSGGKPIKANVIVIREELDEED